MKMNVTKTMAMVLMLFTFVGSAFGCNNQKDAKIQETTEPSVPLFTYEGSNIRYNGDEREIVIPSEIDGKKVETISWVICDGAVEETDITKITFPASATKIYFCDYNSFDQLSEFEVEEGNATYCSEDGVVYSKDKTTLFGCPPAKSDYTIPEFVTTIDGHALTCLHTEEVFIPSTIETVDNLLLHTGDTNIKTIRVDSSFEGNFEIFDAIFEEEVTIICNDVIITAEDIESMEAEYIKSLTNVDTTLLMDINPCYMTFEEFEHNFNVIVPAMFEDKLASIGLSPDAMTLSDPLIEDNDTFYQYRYSLCDGLLFVLVESNPNGYDKNVIGSINISINVYQSYFTNTLDATIQESLFNDGIFLAQLITSPFAVVNDYYSIDELHEFNTNLTSGTPDQTPLGGYSWKYDDDDLIHYIYKEESGSISAAMNFYECQK